MSELKSKKRKFNVEGRVFQQKWESLYFFSIVQNKILCLICIKEITVPKEYNLRRHYEAFHRDKYDVFEGKLREEKLKKLKLDMQRQQNIFTVATKSNDAAIHASFAVSQIIAKNSKPHTDGEYVKKCMIKAVEILCPEKVKLFHAINLSANAVANHVNVFTEDEQLQVKEKCKDFVAYSIAIEENTSVPDHLQLAVYIRGISDDFELAVELLGMLPFNESTSADDIFSGLLSLLSKHVLPWEKMVGFLNDGARVMIDKSDSVAAKFKKIMKDFEGSSSFFTMHCILHQHELCASSLKMDHVIDTVIEIINYIRASAFTHQELLGLLDEVESEHNEIITRIYWKQSEHFCMRRTKPLMIYATYPGLAI
ncbi:PREDICTED: general transcription factor II-I repeat domain-containing protein 2-like [Nicrophorus vespilloides]|uniref:General transcription factor II-I repeat domain-containing protein 2-like n=1 Tax=Nicrophorus vespilloides TaxID=110193 RepID=A0ABM1M6K0_NICVS|nr:PREDICTED: general transcription factor II-I repeat domain-containing protein 2-like [Nicrophorus vespilloides]